ncbi:6-phosphogluconolactonase [Sulfitobacter noctilucae]|uniref:6-phosphogluconolactonase n=1 Tax=Sulfitobacter noctilucae TaxID=1342302 RepID=UPI0004681293|nr:6-phosphogluconolactonase [Sulfitobacter noctilucae]KIN61012.1 6-phosphogluconolactonase [Sulfitobacter noctilucae]
MNFKSYPDREMLVLNVANMLAGELRKCLVQHDIASFAVPGGTTPAPIFEMMRDAELDWPRVHVMLTDERWVPEDHDASNTRLVKTHLLQDRAAQASFVPYYRAGKSAEEGCAEVSQTLSGELPLSLLVLGMGADMHTASLFPGAKGTAAALDANAPLLCPVHPDTTETARVTLPAHVLEGAMSTHVVIFGDEKRAAVERAQTLPPEEAPIATVLGNATVHWAA